MKGITTTSTITCTSPGARCSSTFAGDNLWIVDKDTGEAVKAIVLVCVLPYSMLSYVTALPSAKMEYLFQALSRAVRYFGGVAEVSKTDNMRQWIRKTDRYEPTLNEAASQWCLHNGTELDECRPARPRDKGPAESLVNQTYRYYYSRICRDTFFSYDELNGRLDELNDMFNDRPRKNRIYSRREQYEREERPYMLPIAAKALPPEVHQGNNHQLHLSLPGGQEPLLQRSISAYRQESQGHIRCGDGGSLDQTGQDSGTRQEALGRVLHSRGPHAGKSIWHTDAQRKSMPPISSRRPVR